MDVGVVYACAEAFARAVKAERTDQILSYVQDRQEMEIATVLGGLPRPIRTAELVKVIPPQDELNVISPQDERCTTVTRFNGFRGGKTFQATWAQGKHQPVICEGQTES